MSDSVHIRQLRSIAKGADIMVEIFQRYEKKYLLDEKQYSYITKLLNRYMNHDKFFKTRVNSIYYDTNNYQLIRRSIEKPEYKEKLRIRAYGDINDDDKVFVELKKKYDGIVYKRRTKSVYKDVLKDIYDCKFDDRQVGKEIKYALNYYDHLKPAYFISYLRTSYVANDDKNTRITFDQDIRYRHDHLSLHSEKQDQPITDKIIMELKVNDSIPLWLSHILNEVNVYPQGFSKVGSAYLKELMEV